MTQISVEALAAELQGPEPVVLLDVRREQARSGAGLEIPGTTWRNPAHWLDWKDGFLQTPRVLVYCAHGHEISQGLAATLRAMGVNAVSLEGGFSAWQSAGKPMQPIPQLHSQAAGTETRPDK
jgi:thiosulfate sulfurtransferase